MACTVHESEVLVSAVTGLHATPPISTVVPAMKPAPLTVITVPEVPVSGWTVLSVAVSDVVYVNVVDVVVVLSRAGFSSPNTGYTDDEPTFGYV